MSGFEIVLIMMLVRLILPLGLILWFGEWVRRRERQYWSG